MINNPIKCSPIVIWFASLYVFCIGVVLTVVAFSKYTEVGIVSLVPAILFFLLCGIGCFESITTTMSFTDYGILLEFHKFFPFSYFYPFEMLENITINRRVVRLKHKNKFFGAERFFVRDIDNFKEKLKNTPFTVKE